MEGAQTTPARGSLKRKLDPGFQGQNKHRKVLVVGDQMSKEVQSSTKPCSNHWDYEVFLSFRGADTRKNFTDHLYSALMRTGIRTFCDDNELPRGENISKELINAIHGSRTSLVIFSKDYASSSWCLDELVQILHCKSTMNHIFIPIFYHVNPSDMRKQTGNFAETFDRLEGRFQEDMERVQRWRAAFTEAADCSGFDLQSDANGFEARFIEKIVEQVLYKLNPICLDVVEHPVGIDFHVEEMKTLLQLGTSTTTKLLIMGMYGMGGIGKTTLAKAVYNNICNGFEGSSCLLNVREVSEKSNGLIQLQEQLLFDILKVKILSIGNVDKGISLIKQRLHRKSVLIVLDDVDQLDQIYALATDGEWFFGPGSRVIITTRDEHLLVKLGVNYSYKVEKMNHSDSLQLFSWHAFNMPHPEDDFWEISIAAVDYAGGLPLALEVLGSDLRGRSITKWKTTLEKFRKSPDAQIQEILGISFKSLDHTTREVFLDIACFFIGVNIEYVFKILEECGFFPDIAINILVQKSLVKIDNTNLSMHDLIRDMGREIVRQESRHPGMRSRLWSHEDVLKVLKNHMGSEVVEGLSLNLPIHDQDQVISLESEAFANMKNLRLLQIKGVKNLKLQGCIEHLSKELRWICWHSCPLRFLPPRLHLDNLVVLDMQYSKIKQVWTLENNVLSKLKVLNLSFCEDLTKSPNFLQVPNLEELILEGCTSLVELHDSIGYIKGLVLLNLNGCSSLMNLPKSISNLKSLKNFHMGRCFNMRNFTDKTTIIVPNRSWSLRNFLRVSLHVFRSLVKLGLSNINLLEGDFPIDFGGLSLLQDLDLSVNNFRHLPYSICHLPKLARLNLAESRSIRSISTLPANLQILFAFGCESLERISISESRLDALVLAGCYKLVDIQGFENLAFTKVVSLEGCLEQEEEIDFVKSLLELQWPFMIERRQIYLYGDEIPNWFSHKRTGSSISFHIPSLSDQDRVIKGLVFGVVCRNKDSLQAWHGEISVVFHNKTKGHRQVIHQLFYYKPIGSLNHLVLLQVGLGGGSKIPYGQEMTNGEEIEVSFEFECSQALEYVGVKECGIHLIIQREEEAGSMVMYSEKKKKMMEDDLMQDTPVTKLTRHRPHNWPKVWKYDGIVPFVSYIERNTSTFALLHSLG
ncbi:disease resistance protein RUN1-like isoform X1 [Carya illinoinensis]|uniref:disease resistance protein RUN1-like isoform X1 n=3 Tax=Carya illinoinensis TaxID=32201 RepID=UPI001C7224CB|nr:disease resistance protein RUN1-like isoform X1 [Carya illinoinensis]